MKNKMWVVLVCLSVLIMGCNKKQPQQTDTGTPKQEMNSGGNTTPQTETGATGTQDAAGGTPAQSGSIPAPSDTSVIAPH